MLCLTAFATTLTASATSFSDMAVEEVSYLLSEAASAKDAATKITHLNAAPVPVVVNAADIIGKVYGVIDPALSKGECKANARRLIGLNPTEEADVLWLDSDLGFRLNYSGMLPELSAMARYSGAGATDYGYFFLFPYNKGGKDECGNSQAQFCGALLQEMHDMGLPMNLNTASEDLFEAIGDYNGSMVDVRLLDEPSAETEGAGRYILILSVEPNAFTAADLTAAN
ncbi:MAG: hypothetical protein K2M87_00775 [Muribaculaceae bacterium]|nr:hypothetical protein [Muribaculaceae bacterium]